AQLLSGGLKRSVEPVFPLPARLIHRVPDHARNLILHADYAHLTAGGPASFRHRAYRDFGFGRSVHADYNAHRGSGLFRMSARDAHRAVRLSQDFLRDAAEKEAARRRAPV